MKHSLFIWLVVIGLLFFGGERVLAQTPPPVVINEIQYHAFGDAPGNEYIELYNAGSAPVDLSGWHFSDGIEYTFVTGTQLLPEGYLVVAGDPALVQASYAISGVLGPFAGSRLANSGERIALADAAGQEVDAVTYADQLPWPPRADGDGSTLELRNPAFHNDTPCAWAASINAGTPGARNSAYHEGNLPPCVTGVQHTPPIARSTQPLTITAWVDDAGPLSPTLALTVTLHYRPQGDAAYTALPMIADLTAPQRPRYYASIPPRATGAPLFTQPGQGMYVEFYLTAGDGAGGVTLAPVGAPGFAAATGAPVTRSFLAWIEDTPPPEALPLYRLLLTDANRAELEGRSLFSNEALDASFIYSNTVYYNVGLRYRGESSRSVLPRPYRIKFNDAQEFGSRERINLISDNMAREALTADLFLRAGLPAPETRFVTLYLNGERHGDYLDVEQVDNDFLQAHFADDDNGNLYRAVERGDLSYKGTNPADYSTAYQKKTNAELADYSDVISLTQAFATEGEAEFVAATQRVADMEQWLAWFAVQAVLDNHEGALWIGAGDDYYLYHRPSDDRFVLISWDHDTTFTADFHTIWEPDWYAAPVVRRILHTPAFTRLYYRAIAALLEGAFAPEAMLPRIAALPAFIGAAEKQSLADYVTRRNAYLWANELPAGQLTITSPATLVMLTAQPTVMVEGSCSPLRDVLVNGSPAGVEYLSQTSWRYLAQVTARDTIYVISDGRDSYTLALHRDLFHGGAITQSMTLPPSTYPYSISEDIRLTGNVALTLTGGTTLEFAPDVMIRVEEGACLTIRGEAAHPVLLTAPGDTFWGGILFYGTQCDNRIRYAVLENIHEVLQTPRSHGISAYGGRFTLERSTIRHTRRSNAILGDYNSSVTLLYNHIYDTGSDAIHVTGGWAYLQGNVIHDTFYEPAWNPAPPEGLELSSMENPAYVLDNTFYNISDDCMDLNYASAVIARNIVHHCGDKGISVGHTSSTTLENNLVYGCMGNERDPDNTGFGIAVKDSAVSLLRHNTLVGNRHGLGLYEMHPPQGGGVVRMVNSIVWGNTQAIALRSTSVLTATYSIIAGGWPGEGNRDADPRFSAPDIGDYSLRPDSPAVDSGDPVGAPALDGQGITRPRGAGYDRGAYEMFATHSIYLPLTLRYQAP